MCLCLCLACVWANYRLWSCNVPVRVLLLRAKSISGVAAHVLPAKLDAAASVADRSDICTARLLLQLRPLKRESSRRQNRRISFPVFLAPVPLTCFGVPAYPARETTEYPMAIFLIFIFLLLFRVDYTLFLLPIPAVALLSLFSHEPNWAHWLEASKPQHSSHSS